jgi:serine/threonine protein kinase
MDDVARLAIMRDVASAFHFIHHDLEDMVVAHRDLKSSNVMVQRVDGGWRAKVTDFGTSHLVSALCSSSPGLLEQGTLSHMSPELLDVQGHATAAIDFTKVCTTPPAGRRSTLILAANN